MLKVLVEGTGEIEEDLLVEESHLVLSDGSQVNLARSYRDAPEVDGWVLVPGLPLQPGEMVDVHVTGALAYDLIGEPEVTTNTADLLSLRSAIPLAPRGPI